MWFVYCLIIFLVILIFVCSYFYKLAVCPGKKPFLTGEKDLPEIFLGGICAESKEWMDKVKKTDLSIDSRDDIKLSAFLIPSSKPDQSVFVIIAHGYNSKGMDTAVYARFFNEELDFNVLVPDARGHGKSDGCYIGFGWHDRLDYIGWIRFLIKNYGQGIKIVLFGISMGGAAVLMTSGEELPRNVKAVISDCAYTSAMDILTCQLKIYYGLPSFPVMDILNLMTRLKAGYYLTDASALRQVKKTKIPVLLIHGENDTFVPYEMAVRLYEACGSDKKLFAVEGAGHGESFLRDHDGYRETVMEFIRSTV